MEKHEAYSVLITDDKGRRGTGTLFYAASSHFFYVLTCAHVIYNAQSVTIHILIPTDRDPVERSVLVGKEQFHFSPIDEVTVIGDQSIHTCDIAVIECDVGDIPLKPTQYSIYPMTTREKVMALGYPQGEGPVYYQQDQLSATVVKVLEKENYFLIRVDETFLNSADREAELKGFSGAPVWDEAKIDENNALLGGFIAVGMETNINRGRIKVMNAKYVQSLMREEFGIYMQNRIPDVTDAEIAPGYQEFAESSDQLVVRECWIENERRKGQTYVDGLQLKKAIEVTRAAISNTEFQKCSSDQKYKIYAVLLEAYRLARDFNIYDQIVEEMHRAEITNEREAVIEAIRYLETLDYDRAEEYAEIALEKNPEGNEERVIFAVIQASKNKDADVSMLSEFIGTNDQLLIKPKDEQEEEFIYQILGFILGNRFKDTGRAIRCLNRAFQISGNYIILESLAVSYYLHSLRNAYIEEGRDCIDPFRIDQDAIAKGRDAFLRVLSAADEMWLMGTIRRVGPLMFKCFYFMHDNFRIYKHYHDMIKYFEFPDREMLRDIQLCYLEVALEKETVNLDDFDGLTEYDKKFIGLTNLLRYPLRLFDGGIHVPASMQESELFQLIGEGERRLQELIDTQTDDRLGFDKIHQDFINLYGNGILRYHWSALSEIKRHAAAIKHPLETEVLQLYIRELELDDFARSEKEYNDYFEGKRDVISFNQLCHFYTRHGKIEKTKELYDSVFKERRHLINNQAEYFYREYIMFYMEHHYDLTAPLKCFVEHGDEMKDVYLRMLFEMDLNFATVTFNNPNYMLENVKTLLDEGLIELSEYNCRCLIINMLNCKPHEAEKYANRENECNPSRLSEYERMLFVWKGHQVVHDARWNSMQEYTLEQLCDIYTRESWLLPVCSVMEQYRLKKRKAIVVDLWGLYILQKIKAPAIMDYFEKVYITHNTILMALQEISKVNDGDVRKVLTYIQTSKNVIIQSPTIKDQLEVRTQGAKYTEMHQVLLLAELLDCPALVGEFRYLIPERFQCRMIRPNCISEMRKYLEERFLP